MKPRYRCNEPDVTYELFDTEILVINLKNGNYYSLLGTAVPVWQLLLQGQPVDEISRALAGSCQADEPGVTAAIGEFVATLEAESLLLRSEKPIEPDASTAIALPTAFTPPKFDRYTDMQQLLLMDPIHEVDATGWPMAKNPEQPGK